VYFWIFPAVCGLFAIVATLVSVVAVLRQKAEFDKRRRRLSALGSFVDTARLEAAVARIRTDVDAMPPLLARANIALESIKTSAGVLRIRRARAAIALTALSIRALAATLRAYA